MKSSRAHYRPMQRLWPDHKFVFTLDSFPTVRQGTSEACCLVQIAAWFCSTAAVLNRPVMNSWCSNQTALLLSTAPSDQGQFKWNNSLHANLCGRFLHINQSSKIMRRDTHNKVISKTTKSVLSVVLSTIVAVKCLKVTTTIWLNTDNRIKSCHC